MSKLPVPVAAALGLVPTALDGVRRLPAKAATLPVLAVSSALTVLETARREYDELAVRGERFIDNLRGASPDGEAVAETVQTASPTALQSAPTVVQSAPAVVESAASAEVIDLVEQVVELTDVEAVASRDELPLPDYDHMTLGSLRGKLRTLTMDQLVQIRDYEKAHAHRLPVVTLLDNRIAKLATG
jgi:hypothetical protein